MLRKWIIPVLIGLFNVSLLAFPRDVLNAAREGLLLWFSTVLPSLLPFVIATNLLVGLGVLRLFPGGVAAFVMGLISGYPMGAKTVGDLCRTGDITKQQARQFLTFCNNAGPLFIVGAVGIGMFGSVRVGYTLWAGHVLAALVIALGGRVLFGKISSVQKKHINNFNAPSVPTHYNKSPRFGEVLGASVKNAMEAMALVGGLIIFFNVAVRVLLIFTGLDEGGGYIAGVLGGIFEISGGVRRIASVGLDAQGLHIVGANIQGIHTAALALTAGIIGFGGLSVHAQALYFASNTGVRHSVYIACKALHGLLAAGITAGIWILL